MVALRTVEPTVVISINYVTAISDEPRPRAFRLCQLPVCRARAVGGKLKYRRCPSCVCVFFYVTRLVFIESLRKDYYYYYYNIYYLIV